jgi:hypothetical protein
LVSVAFGCGGKGFKRFNERLTNLEEICYANLVDMIFFSFQIRLEGLYGRMKVHPNRADKSKE